MITFAICLIYYGIALLVYQLNGWATQGRWPPFPVQRAWDAFLGPLSIDSPVLRPIVNWLLGLPLSLTLLVTGVAILVAVFGYRRRAEARRYRLRRQWIAEQCKAFGYNAWDLPKVLKELDDEVVAQRANGRD